MDPTERYLFDLNGYLVIRDALSAEVVVAINRAFGDGCPGRYQGRPTA
jgi:hypothetical protein